MMQYTDTALRDGGRRRWWRGHGLSFEVTSSPATGLDRPSSHVALHVGPLGLLVAAQCRPGYTVLTAQWTLTVPWTRPPVPDDVDRARRGKGA